MKIRYITFICALLFTAFSAKAQLPNDDCFGAQALGVLGAPAACPSGVGPIQNFNNLTNVNSIGEQPYTTLINCQPSNLTPMASPATDVWYSFVNNGNEITITINGNIQNPNIGLYDGTALGCNGLVGRGCAIGAGGTLTVTFDQLVPGNTYYLQISGGDDLDQGTFNMTLQNNNSCADCLLSSNLTVNPLPNANGMYAGGTAVTFCYTVTDWEQQNTNWIHAVIPTFGSGWNMATLGGFVPAATCDGGPGIWDWFTNVVTPNGNGNLTGFFFDGDVIQSNPNGDPTDNYGDNCNGSGLNWTFCWTITTKACPPGTDGQDLSVNIDTYGDGETGNWTNIACTNDPIYQFNATLACCTPPVMAHVDLDCFGDNDGTGTATGQGVGPFNYVWKDATNTTIQTDNNLAGASTATGLSGGTYTVTVTDQNNGCVTTGTVTIIEPTQLQLLIATTPATCNQADGTGTVTPQGGTGPYDFVWTDANGGNVQTDNNLPGASNANGLAQGSYDIDVTDANGCTATVTINVQGSQGNVQAAIVEVPTSCPDVCDGSATVNLNGGTAPYDIQWDANANNQITATATNLCAGTYTVTYTDANNCGGTTTATITEPPALAAQFIASPQPTDIFDAEITFTDQSTGGPTQWDWYFDAFGTSSSQNPVFTFPAVPGCYEVILVVNNANNCPDSDTVLVCIQPNFSMYFPNAFTPNGDNTNDYFRGYGEGIQDYQMWIFNRWGQPIFYTDDIAGAWNGCMNGDVNRMVCPIDIYVYRAFVVDIFGLEHNYYGKVALIR